MTTDIRNQTVETTPQSGGASEQSVSKTPATYEPAVDIFEAEHAYTLFVDLPGADRESVDLTVEGDSLIVEASAPQRFTERSGEWLVREFGVGDYRRIFRLGEDVDAERISASYDAGVLTLTLPKRESAVPRRIKINTE